MSPIVENMTDSLDEHLDLVFERQEDGGYHVFAPDLPGLHSQGDSLADAKENAQEALELYIEAMREDGQTVDIRLLRPRFRMPS